MGRAKMKGVPVNTFVVELADISSTLLHPGLTSNATSQLLPSGTDVIYSSRTVIWNASQFRRNIECLLQLKSTKSQKIEANLAIYAYCIYILNKGHITPKLVDEKTDLKAQVVLVVYGRCFNFQSSNLGSKPLPNNFSV